MKYRDLIRQIEKDGWRLNSVRGSHHHYEHPAKPGKVTITGKPGQDVPLGTLAAMLKQAGLK